MEHLHPPDSWGHFIGPTVPNCRRAPLVLTRPLSENVVAFAEATLFTDGSIRVQTYPLVPDYPEGCFSLQVTPERMVNPEEAAEQLIRELFCGLGLLSCQPWELIPQ